MNAETTAADPSRRALLGAVASLAIVAAPAAAQGKRKGGNKPKPPQAAVIAKVASVELNDGKFTIFVDVSGNNLLVDPPAAFSFGLFTSVDFAPAARMQAQLVTRIQETVANDDELSGVQPDRVAVFVVSDLS